MSPCLGSRPAALPRWRNDNVTTFGCQMLRDSFASTVVPAALNRPFEIGRASDLLIVGNQRRASHRIDRDFLDTGDAAQPLLHPTRTKR